MKNNFINDLLNFKCFLKESSITEAVEKQLQGSVPIMSTSPHQQASLTPLMGKRPQMGTHVVQQHQQQQQIDPAITPLSGTSLSSTFFAIVPLFQHDMRL